MPSPTPQAPSAFESDPAALRAVARIRERMPEADPLALLPDVHPAKIPRHIAIIMDGNGRWAKARGLDRAEGHKAGARTIADILDESGRLGVEQLTLYSFSQENWKRPAEEVSALMQLCTEQLYAQRDRMVANNVRFRVIGDRSDLPEDVAAGIEMVEEATGDRKGITLCLAFNYGGRAEIVEAARSLARDVAAGTLKPEAIDEAAFTSRLSTAGMPDPDLLIRTAGELRVSNYLLWQISYAEIHGTRVLWPDFSRNDLHAAVRDFASRTRKFGGLAGVG